MLNHIQLIHVHTSKLFIKVVTLLLMDFSCVSLLNRSCLWSDTVFSSDTICLLASSNEVERSSFDIVMASSLCCRWELSNDSVEESIDNTGKSVCVDWSSVERGEEEREGRGSVCVHWSFIVGGFFIGKEFEIESVCVEEFKSELELRWDESCTSLLICTSVVVV